ncbi:MAG: hypothetical protein K0S37_1488 [Microbacterium sp.]|jgi:glycosyltransferase involved in cell wall biosynthesis|nr:hypothetical protein [Microbacterium sp.]
MTLEIFVPFWGDPALLYATIDSVRAQHNPDWTLTVIDDCYPDDSVPAYFAAIEDERITYTRNEHNLGITENYREAVRRATGEHMTILGCDDLMHPNYVDVIARAIGAVPHADVIQPGVDVIDEHGTVIDPLLDRVKRDALAPRGVGVAVLTGQAMANSLIRGNWLYWPSITFRTETLRRIDFREGLPIIQDLALLMDIGFEGGTLAYIPITAFSYRRHLASASQKTLYDGRRFRDERAYFAQARAQAQSIGWRRTSTIARLRVISRLHAIAELPGIVRHGSRTGIQSALAHIFAL